MFSFLFFVCSCGVRVHRCVCVPARVRVCTYVYMCMCVCMPVEARGQSYCHFSGAVYLFLLEARRFHYLNLSSWYLGSRDTPVSTGYDIDSNKNENAVSLPCPGSRKDTCYGVRPCWFRAQIQGQRNAEMESVSWAHHRHFLPSSIPSLFGTVIVWK